MRIDFTDNQQTVKPRVLKFGLNIKTNESVMCTNFWDPTSRDHELRHTKNIKRHFLSRKFTNSLITQKPLHVRSRNLDSTWLLMNALCKPSLGARGDQHFTGRKWAKS